MQKVKMKKETVQPQPGKSSKTRGSGSARCGKAEKQAAPNLAAFCRRRFLACFLTCHMQGDSLLEIMLALWLIGMVALGAANLQLAALHAQQSALWRAHAANLAAAAAEALRSGYPEGRLTAAWRERAKARLPDGGMHILNQGAKIRLIILYWKEPAHWLDAPAHQGGDCAQASTSESFWSLSAGTKAWPELALYAHPQTTSGFTHCVTIAVAA